MCRKMPSSCAWRTAHILISGWRVANLKRMAHLFSSQRWWNPSSPRVSLNLVELMPLPNPNASEGTRRQRSKRLVSERTGNRQGRNLLRAEATVPDDLVRAEVAAPGRAVLESQAGEDPETSSATLRPREKLGPAGKHSEELVAVPPRDPDAGKARTQPSGRRDVPTAPLGSPGEMIRPPAVSVVNAGLGGGGNRGGQEASPVRAQPVRAARVPVPAKHPVLRSTERPWLSDEELVSVSVNF